MILWLADDYRGKGFTADSAASPESGVNSGQSSVKIIYRPGTENMEKI